MNQFLDSLRCKEEENVPDEIAPGVYSIGQNKAGQIHAYLLDDGNGLTAIDTLFDTDAG